MASILVIGPVGAAVIAALTDWISNVRRPWPRRFLNASQVILAVLSAGAIYYATVFAASAIGFPSPESRPARPWTIPLFILGPAWVYYRVSTFVVSKAISLSTGASRRLVWGYNYQWQWVLVPAMTVPFGSALVISWTHLSPIEMALACLSAIFAQQAVTGALQKRAATFDVIRRLAAQADRTHESTEGYSERLASYSVQVAWELGLTKERTENLEFAAWLHNFGTLPIKHTLLIQPRDLTESERALVEEHPRLAHDLAEDLPELREAAEILLLHHEHPDGSGYPQGLRGPIPVESSILLAVDAFDSMIRGRARAQPVEPQEAYRRLRDGAGHEFDSVAVEALILLHQGQRLYDRVEDNPALAAVNRFGARVMALECSDRLENVAPRLRAALGELLPTRNRTPFSALGRSTGNPARASAKDQLRLRRRLPRFGAPEEGSQAAGGAGPVPG